MVNILIIGGARSGKSHFAQELARKADRPVLFVATALAGDEEMRQRIAAHRQARPADWSTLEVTTRIASEISRKIGDAGVVIIDCLTLLMSNILGQYAASTGEQIDAALVEQKVTGEIDELIDCLKRRDCAFIIVTNEVGAGLVPDNRMGRLYRDLLGRANQRLAQQVDEVYFMVAGLAVRIKPAS